MSCLAAWVTNAASADFEVEGPSWNGLSQLVTLAREEEIELATPDSLELDTLTARDGLLIVHPQRRPPAADLVAFMREGGRVGLMDDFGAGVPLLDTFHIRRRAPPSPPDDVRLRGNRNVVIATPQAEHPLAQGVLALVLNHPRVLHHDRLQPIFALGEAQDAVVLAGAVGPGRLVAVADSSVLINNMLQFRGNRRFARNLLRYLAPGGRLLLLAGDARFTGSYGDAGSPLSQLSERLDDFANRPLPPHTVLLLTLGISGLLLFVAVTSLPQQSTYVRAVTLRAPQVVAGFAGRVGFFASKTRNLLPPLMSYKLEFEYRLVACLGLTPHPPLSGVVEGLRAAGLAESDVEDARALLLELDRFKLAQERPETPPRVSSRRFRSLIARGDRILAAVQAQDPNVR